MDQQIISLYAKTTVKLVVLIDNCKFTFNIFSDILNFIINPLIRIQMPSVQSSMLLYYTIVHFTITMHGRHWYFFSVSNLAMISTDCLQPANITIHKCQFTENSSPVLHFNNDDNQSPCKANLAIMDRLKYSRVGLGTTSMQ